jgi:hypothetical protein
LISKSLSFFGIINFLRNTVISFQFCVLLELLLQFLVYALRVVISLLVLFRVKTISWILDS